MTTPPIRDKNHSHFNRNSTSYCAVYMNGNAANPIARLSGLIFDDTANLLEAISWFSH